MIAFRGCQIFAPVGAAANRPHPRQPPVPPDQRPLRFGGSPAYRQTDACPGYAATGPGRKSPDAQRHAPPQLA